MYDVKLLVQKIKIYFKGSDEYGKIENFLSICTNLYYRTVLIYYIFVNSITDMLLLPY
jgi:hypothetical protein